ncbi:MAG: hypothetical protein M1826_000878 [Phylliscum demangeonii]|nr:MAG: hypothetical protein M1826_000878 [Phylliscum demangeonii]
MAIKKTRVVVPTTYALIHSDRLPSHHPIVVKALSRVSRPGLLSLVLQWLSEENETVCGPYLLAQEEEQPAGIYHAARSLDELADVYRDLQGRHGVRKEVVERVVECDWKHGISLKQLAMVDVRYLSEHPNGHKWFGLKLVRMKAAEPELCPAPSPRGMDTSALPRFHAQTFLRNLQHEIGPLLRAHFYLTRLDSLPLTLLRVQIHDSPYGGQQLLHDTATQGNELNKFKTLFVAFPDGTPAIYVSLATPRGEKHGHEGLNLRAIVLDALPKAISRPNVRYMCEPTSLTTRTLSAMVALRGPGRGAACAGGWSIFADGSVDRTPLERQKPASPAPPPPPPRAPSSKRKAFDLGLCEPEVKGGRVRTTQAETWEAAEDDAWLKRRKVVARGRFGNAGVEEDGKGLERLEIRLEDGWPRPVTTALGERDGNGGVRSLTGSDGGQPQPWRPQIRLTFQGTHVVAGLRRLVETGVLDGERMPGWMTGEAGVSVGVVRHGRIMGAAKVLGL